MTIISVDLGLARTGLAICDKTGFLASSLCVIEEKNMDRLLNKIAQIAIEERAEKIVVGLPKNMDGSQGESAKRAKDFADKLKKITGIPICLQDERGTTITAHNYLSQQQVFGKKRKKQVDAVAASIILQDYLDKIRKEKENG